MTDQQKGLFLGRRADPASGKTTADPLFFDPNDLTTHGLIVGMTGSGKTALGIVLIEELLRKGIPVLAIDPKGDIGNLLLAFPGLTEAEFAPWVDPSAPGGAAGEAGRWTAGLAGWGMGPADVAALSACRDATIYTPGSLAGTPIDLLGSCAPPPPGSGEEEAREVVSSFVSGLLGLLGLDADPVKSREHILLSKCVDALHASGKTATLEALVPAASEPPFAAVGALPLESFYPAKARQELVLSLNNLLASPSTEAFRAGEPLSVEAMLGRSGGGRARLSIVSIAHLGDAERSFVVATLLSQVRAWMRRQPGSPSLKAVVYVDEIFGFFPPSGEPPAKKPLLGLLKQARAFGLGVVLATQNPVDLDYKGLANCGCWWIGTLQAARDRERLQDGLTNAAGSAETIGLLDRTRKRVFLLHDIHRGGPALVETRWAMSYLRGPMTKEEIAKLKGSGPAGTAATAATDDRTAPAASASSAAASAVPLVPKPWSSKWVDLRGADLATPYLLVRFAVRYRDGKASSDEWKAARLWPLGAGSPAEVLEEEPRDAGTLLDAAPDRELRYEPLPGWLGPAGVKDVEKALRERLPDRLAARLLVDDATGKVSLPGEDADAFAARIAGARALTPAQQAKLDRKRRDLAAAEEQEKQRSQETLTTGLMAAADLIGGLLGKRKTLKTGKVGSVLGKRRMETAAESKVEALRAEVEALEAQAGAPDPSAFRAVDVVPARAHVDLLSVGVAWVC